MVHVQHGRLEIERGRDGSGRNVRQHSEGVARALAQGQLDQRREHADGHAWQAIQQGALAHVQRCERGGATSARGWPDRGTLRQYEVASERTDGRKWGKLLAEQGGSRVDVARVVPVQDRHQGERHRALKERSAHDRWFITDVPTAQPCRALFFFLFAVAYQACRRRRDVGALEQRGQRRDERRPRAGMVERSCAAQHHNRVRDYRRLCGVCGRRAKGRLRTLAGERQNARATNGRVDDAPCVSPRRAPRSLRTSGIVLGMATASCTAAVSHDRTRAVVGRVLGAWTATAAARSQPARMGAAKTSERGFRKKPWIVCDQRLARALCPG